jgi:hypothetical protein
MKNRDIALISMFSAMWVASQLYLGPMIGQLTTVHGVVQRFMGWFLLLIVAEVTGRFGRASLLATIAAFATRIIRRSASLYIWVVAVGYAFGGVVFDALFFLPVMRRFQGAHRNGYLIAASLTSGILATVPYILYKLMTLGLIPFIVWLPIYLPKASIDVGLNVAGTIVAFLVAPHIRIFSTAYREPA